MKSNLGHIQINIDPGHLEFYKKLFDFLGWSVLYQDDGMLGVGDEHGAGLWFVNGLKQVSNDYDGHGMNHLAIAVENQADVDKVVAYLKENKIEALFETPRHRPEFSDGPDQTYYQVMFTSPDCILLEVVYTGPLAR